MFEASFIRKYLTPRKKQLSSSLIALLSIAVISLVVWLIVLFLSVTEGIEKGWLQKLTALNAPVRIEPTQEYFSSYYYNVDKYSASSHYMSKTVGQKARSLISDPYDPDFDETLPIEIARPEQDRSGRLKDPVKELVRILDDLNLTHQDVEMSGALLRLNLLRQEKNTLQPAEMQRQLTNVSYLASFPNKNPSLDDLLLKPTVEDLNHLLFLAKRSSKSANEVLSHSHIEMLKTRCDLWRMPLDLLPERTHLFVQPYKHKDTISHLLIPNSPTESSSAKLTRRGKHLFLTVDGQPEVPLSKDIPLFAYGKLDLEVTGSNDLEFDIVAKLQNQIIRGSVPFEGLEVKTASFEDSFDGMPDVDPVWPFFQNGGKASLPHTDEKSGILMAKNFRENGVLIGDEGYLTYSTPSLTGAKDKQIPVYISGFYDPGIMAVGNKCILVPQSITEMINSTQHSFTLDRSESNNVFVWFPNLGDAKGVKQSILQKLHDEGIAKYWKVSTFHEYEFAKDLMQQFQSDKYLFSLIGVIILLVACTNIISLLILLVSDKKKEIGVLRAMGAKRRSIAGIFALSGASLGLFSCLLGLFLAYITLQNIDHLVHFLSLLQGHDAFNTQFFGQSLPKEISPRALLFAAIATPVLALVAGLVPAIKAARLNPCDTLRSE